MRVGIAIPIAASALVMVSVACGWLSFRFAEEGAAPDDSTDPFGIDVDFDQQIIERGERRRARLCARLFFNMGALCLLSSVPLGYADAHESALLTEFVITSAALLLIASIYIFAVAAKLWQDLREDAVSAWYDGKKFSQFYHNREAMRQLFFSLNPLPMWSIFDPRWAQKLRYPNAEEALVADRGTASS